MIKVKIHRDDAGTVDGLKVSGHAGYAENGEDIICAAVSTLTETAVGYAECLLNPDDVKEKRAYTMKNGSLTWQRPDDYEKYAEALKHVFDAMVFGLKQVAESAGTDESGKMYLVVSD